MKNRKHSVCLTALLALAAAGCGAMGEERTATITRTWPAGAITRVGVRDVNGSIDIAAVPAATQISLVARVRARGMRPDPSKENQGYFQTTLEGDSLQIGQRHHVHVNIPFFYSNSVTVDYQLQVPPSVELDLQTINGRIATRGIDGETRATSVNGSLDLETTGKRELTAKTVNGRVRARFLNDFEGAHIKSVNGGVDAVLPQSASFACDVSQVNGDFEASFPLAIHSNPGRRRVSGEVNGGRYDLRIVTVNGDVHLANAPIPPTAPVPPAPVMEVPKVPAVPPVPPLPPLPSTGAE